MRSALWLVVLAGCSGGAHEAQIGPPPPRQSDVAPTKCRDATTPIEPPTGDSKRFEVKLSSSQELWASVGATHLYKTPEHSEECWYVDLPAGNTDVTLRASDKNGVSAALAIHELGTQTKSWYDTFSFNCGAPGVCSYDELTAFKDAQAQHKRGIADGCGSVKIKALTWDAQHAPDAAHPGDLLLHLTLDIYKRAPDKAHGDPACTK
jgi:hypothetical protein